MQREFTTLHDERIILARVEQMLQRAEVPDERPVLYLEFPSMVPER